MNKLKLSKRFRWLIALLVVGGGIVLGRVVWASYTLLEVQPAIITQVATLHEDGDVRGLAFSPDGRYLAVDRAPSNSIHVWDWRTKRLLHTLYKGRGSSSISSTTPLLYSPDGRFLVSCHKAARQGKHSNIVINVWNAQTGKSLKNIDDSDCSAMAFTPNGQELLRLDPSVRRGFDDLVSYSTRTWKRRWGIFTGPFAPKSMAISPNGKLVALGGLWYGPSKSIFDINIRIQIEILDLVSHKVVRTITAAFPNPHLDHGTFVMPSDIQALTWSANGKYLAAGIWHPSWHGADAVRIFNVDTGEKVLGQPGPRGTQISGLAYTPNGRYLIESGIGHSIKALVHQIVGHYIEIWDADHQHLLARIAAASDSLAVSSSGRYTAIGGVGHSGGGKIIVWKLK